MAAILEKLFFGLKSRIRSTADWTVPYLRRAIRFAALPVFFFSGIDWDVCPRSRTKVAFDLLYIFFRLKYFPDNYSLCRLWEKDRSQWHLYYGSIYNPYPRYRLRKEVQPKEYLILFDDKHVCRQICRSGGLPVPEQPAYIQLHEDAGGIIGEILDADPSRELIVKPSRGRAGLGVTLVREVEGQRQCVQAGQTFPVEDLILETPAVVQYRVAQHPVLQAVSPSTNTLRVVTLLAGSGEVLLVGGISKFGRGDAFLDNRSRGGMGAGVDMETGRLYKHALDFRSRSHLRHPDSGVVFEGFQLPYWDRVQQLAGKAQRLFPYYRLLGLDIAFGEDGPVILEINASHDNVGLEQVAGGILAQGRVHEEFLRYGLLFNRPSVARVGSEGAASGVVV